MPELPEVETTVRGLRRAVVGKVITDFWADWPRSLRTHTISSLRKKIKNKTITSIDRRGKNIIFELASLGSPTPKLTPKLYLLVHMKMTGHLLYGAYSKVKIQSAKIKGKVLWIANKSGPLRDDPYNQRIRTVFSFEDQTQLAFSDLRRFGKIELYSNKQELDKSLSKLGPDMLGIGLGEFVKWVGNKKGKIKQVLLDQSVITGIGNIYSDEILWHAGIHPKTKIAGLSKSMIYHTLVIAKDLLKKGIKMRGDSMSDYRNIDGRKGKFQVEHKAYRRTGQKCEKHGCRGMIVRIKIGGRGAHFCDTHQKLY